MDDPQKLAELTAKAITESAARAARRANALSEDVEQAGRALIADLEAMTGYARDTITRISNNCRRDMAQFTNEIEQRSRVLGERTAAYMAHTAASIKAFEKHMPSRGEPPLPEEDRLPRVVSTLPRNIARTETTK